ncbi:hypothetical protein [Nocardia alni]|uniref:hypothetical protein n=1 Tax=Nocardia alni TaxID=2815723 RepID=UPI001C2227F9|nr:hypothetical protein [Nocardia alni]
MWQYALWGIGGAAANCGVVFLEVSKRVKGWPWRKDNRGPGGGVYATWLLVHCGIAGLAASALATSHLVVTPVIAFGTGAAAPIVVKKLAAYAESRLPGTSANDDRDQSGDNGRH